jgi:hypothetical protein
VAAAVIIIGFMLLLAGLSDGSGNLRRPGYSSILYIAAVIGVAALLILAGRKQRVARKSR